MSTYGAVLEVLADPTRRELVERLRRAPSAVADLAAGMPVTRPAVSQHLKVLRAAGLVESEREGTRNVYRLRPDGLAPLRDWIEEFWNEPLSAYVKAAAQRAGRRKTKGDQ